MVVIIKNFQMYSDYSVEPGIRIPLQEVQFQGKSYL